MQFIWVFVALCVFLWTFCGFRCAMALFHPNSIRFLDISMFLLGVRWPCLWNIAIFMPCTSVSMRFSVHCSVRFKAIPINFVQILKKPHFFSYKKSFFAKTLFIPNWLASLYRLMRVKMVARGVRNFMMFEYLCR